MRPGAQVQEFFGDFVVVDPHHVAVPVARPHVVLQPFAWDYANATDAVSRMTEGLASLMLSLRRRFAIRHDTLRMLNDGQCLTRLFDEDKCSSSWSGHRTNVMRRRRKKWRFMAQVNYAQ